MADLIENNKLYWHPESAGFCRVMLNDAILHETMERAVIYHTLADNRVWAMAYKNFANGQFELAAGES